MRTEEIVISNSSNVKKGSLGADGNLEQFKNGKSDLRVGVRRGLSESEAEESRRIHGSNRFTVKRRQSFFRRFLKELGDPIIRILLCALVVTLILPGGDGGNLDAIGIAVAVLIATLVSTACEYGSERAFEAMRREAGEQTCRVIRDGSEKVLTVGDVVVGDVVRLRAGERIPADGRLVEGMLSCDLSALNGESTEQKKYADSWEPAGPRETRQSDDRLGERSALFRGSEITSGEGVMVITAVGDGTYYGRMARELQGNSGDSPLKIKLTRLAKTLSRFGYACAIAVGVSNFLFSTVFSSSFIWSFQSLLGAAMHALTLAVSVVVMAVPEGLPMMITVVLASNMVKMQKQKVLVRKPVGIETAGSINILFTDKTGTLTYGKPRVSGYVFSDSEVRTASEISDGRKKLMEWIAVYACGADTGNSGDEAEALNATARLLHRSSVENRQKSKERKYSKKDTYNKDVYSKDAYNKYEGKISVGAGDAADIAIRRDFLSYGSIGTQAERIAYLPFTSTEKLCAACIASSDRSGILHGKSGMLTLIKGAPEILLERCEYAYMADGGVKRIDTARLTARLRELASSGARVIAAVTSECGVEAVREAASSAAAGERIEVEKLFLRTTFVAFICLNDNLRENAIEAVAELHGAGIQTVMITGDNPFTAEAIAREAGILSRGAAEYGEILTGSELSTMSDSRLSELLPRIRVIARALPEDKSRLVRVASARGMVVGMTGDGLNDAPALKQADVGFAMGSGTDVAKEAGDIVITDNDISSIVRAVHFGRTIFKSIRKFIVFQLTMNLCAVGISIIGPFIGYESPVSVMQMLWINIIIDTLAALAFAGEAPLRSYMRESPVPKSAPVLSSHMISKIIVLGLYTLLLCVYFLASPHTVRMFGGGERILTGFFALFIFSGIIGGLNARASGVNPFRGLGLNPTFLAIMCGIFTAQVAMIYYGGRVFGTVPLSIREFGYIIALASTVIPVGAIYGIVAGGNGRGSRSFIARGDIVRK